MITQILPPVQCPMGLMSVCLYVSLQPLQPDVFLWQAAALSAQSRGADGGGTPAPAGDRGNDHGVDGGQEGARSCSEQMPSQGNSVCLCGSENPVPAMSVRTTLHGAGVSGERVSIHFLGLFPTHPLLYRVCTQHPLRCPFSWGHLRSNKVNKCHTERKILT